MKRPTDKDVLPRDLAKTITNDVVKWLNEKESSNQEIEDMLTEVIDDLGYHCDGYEFAKELEEKHYFSPDANLVDILDCVYSNLNEAKNALIETWVKENNINPKLNVGDIVNVEIAKSFHKKIYSGKIIKINEKHATYTICISELGHVEFGCGTLGSIVAFEDVELLNIK